MKGKFIRIVCASIVAVCFLLTFSSAATSYQESNVPIGSSNEVTMVGEIAPHIMSVTMPTYIGFDVSASVQGANKVVSPRINIINNSNIPVSVNVTYTRVDLSQVNGATWTNNGDSVRSNEIAIGFQEELVENESPVSLDRTKWLSSGRQNTNVTTLSPYGNSYLYVVGNLGSSVNDGIITVVPTLVARES